MKKKKTLVLISVMCLISFIFISCISPKAAFAEAIDSSVTDAVYGYSSGENADEFDETSDFSLSTVGESDKAITSFDFAALDPAVTGTVDEDAKRVALTVPYDTDVTALVPAITHTGASISPESGVAQDFTNPIIYKVTAEEGSSQEYTVTVTVAQEPPFLDAAPMKALNLNMSGMGSVPVTGFGKTIEFNGTKYVEMPINSSHNITSNFTVEFWYKPASIDQPGSYLLSRNGKDPSQQWAVLFRSVNNYVEFYSHSNGFTGANPRNDSQMMINDTAWHHIAYSYDGTNWSGYLDGEQIFSVSRNFTLKTCDNYLYIGGTVGSGGATAETQGRIDEVRIWKKGLSGQTIANWMYREVDSTHPNYTDLANYYKLNEGSGTAVNDAKGIVNGTLTNGSDSDWKDSDIIQIFSMGDNVTGILYPDGLLEVTGTGAMTNYTNVSFKETPWYAIKDMVNKIVIDEGVTTVGDYIFKDFVNVTLLTISNSVTSIGKSAFHNCKSLTSINIPNSVTSIGNGALGFTGLTSVTIPDSVESLGSGVFQWCTSLSTVTLPTSLKRIEGYLFQNCTSLTSINIPNSVTFIGDWAFQNCTSLTSINIPNLVTYIGSRAFENCKNLTSIINHYNGIQSVGSNAFATGATAPRTAASYSANALFVNAVTANGYTINYLYTVTFKDWNGTVLKTQTVNDGGAATAPTDPMRPADAQYTYTFAGWDKDFSNITGNLTIIATYSKELNSYIVTFKNYDGTTLGTPQTVAYGSKTTAPANPVRADYTFDSWYANPELTNAFDFNTGITGDISLCAKWTPVAYGITYNLNEGTNYVGAPQSYTIESETITLGMPARTGYTFAGWYDAETGGSQVTEIAQGSTGEKTLYARWNANTNTPYKTEHYIQDVSGNGYTLRDTDNLTGTTDTTATAVAKDYTGFTENTSHAGRVASGNIAADETLVLKLYYDRDTYTVRFDSNGGTNVAELAGIRYEAILQEPPAPTKTGYTFAGWYSNLELTNAFDTDITGNITLYAKWDPITYNITYSLNGGTNYEGAPDSYTIESESVTLGTAARTGYTFGGWYEAETGGSQVTVIAQGSTGEKTLYARWAANTDTAYKVEHYVQDTSGSGYTIRDTDNLTGTTDTTATAAAKNYTGFTENTSYVGRLASGNISADGTLVLKLYYDRDTYTVSFDSNGGTTVSEIADIRYEATMTSPVAPTRGGYTFVGWYSNLELTNDFDFDTVITGNITLYAKWDPITYNITYNLNGGTNYEGAPLINTIESETITLGTPVRTGYAFAGWYDAENGGSQVTVIAKGSTGDKTLYAKWAASTDTAYKVEHYVQDVSGSGYTLKDTDNLTGTTDTTATAAAKNYTGFTENTSHANRAAGGNISADGKLVLKLYYDRDTYTVSFNSNGGTTVSEIAGIRYEATIQEPVAPTRSGYTFVGWYSNPELTNAFDFGTAITGNITLYAKWNRNSSSASSVNDVEVEVLVNGKGEKAGKVSITQEGDKTKVTIIVDENKLEQKLLQEGNNTIVTIPVNGEADVFIGQLNGQIVKNMENKQAVVEIKTEGAAYSLPAQQINIDAVSKLIGTSVQLKDINVQIEIAKPADTTVKVIEDSANKDSFILVVPPVEFKVTCTYENKTVEVDQFNSYVERTMAIPDGVDPAKITTGVIVEPDGTVRHVPTKIIVIDGKYHARINSLTNSAYTVIWHPTEFKDAGSHWAKEAINDMGSRMVISGVGNDTFEPDRDITRAEFAAVIVRALGLKPDLGQNMFSDVPADAWYSSYVRTASEYRIISGYGDGKFGPKSKIAREQAMVMVARAMNITELKVEFAPGEVEKLLEGYKDAEEFADYARNDIAACIKAGVVTGKNDKLIAPKDKITRAEVAVIIQRLLQKSNLI